MTTHIFHNSRSIIKHINEWIVESVDMDNDGDIETALFTGHNAKQRAEKYAKDQYDKEAE